jgi:class 3 adenylate cyclase/tetratricopeptide (TPR) repeat protein
MAVSRKTVTVLFADVADSTRLGERLDPESVRGALGRWFEVASEVIGSHGGTVEKFIGDAVMAVFGIPQLHEDDAVRAVRAADGLRLALARLNDELEGERGLRLAVRVGVNTGEVVTGDGAGTLVTGDAVNVAKRLEESAANGDVVVGEPTRVLAREAAHFEQLAPLEAKGKSEPVRAWRLVGVDPWSPGFERRLGTPLVGRQDELQTLRDAYARAVEERTCQLFTVLGPAGIGKTRLAWELFDEIRDEATVLAGRCLPYGEGITFWPLREVLLELGNDAIGDLVAGLDDANLIVERLPGAAEGAAADSQETFWAVRKLCETLADRQPLVVCFEDIHWAEPTFLDLIEYLASWIRDAPMLLLCLARPEFSDDHPTWLAPQTHASYLSLPPLSSAESEALLDAHGIFGRTRDQIAEAAEGNPLYAEQMAAMVAEGGYEDGMFTIPPSIQSLLAARLDRLTSTERELIETASVCGKQFWRDALVELTAADRRSTVGATLMSLVRKELLRPHRSTARPDDAFRFGHVLIQDAAYSSVPKGRRADLHERFAGWLRANVGERGPEVDEIVGYHLEQAHRYLVELGPTDARGRALAGEAGQLLASAGRRAIARDDAPAAIKLLERARRLVDERTAAGLLPDLGAANALLGELGRASEILDEAIERARALDDPRLEGTAMIERALVKIYAEPTAADVEGVAEHVIPFFERARDELGLARAWHLVSVKHFSRCEFAAMGDAVEEALTHARRAGDIRQEHRSLALGAFAVAMGPTPVEDAIERCRAIRRQTADESSIQGIATGNLAELEAMRGRFDEARGLCADAKAILEERGRVLHLASVALYSGPVEFLAGEPEAAERELRWAYDILEAIGERGAISLVTAFLARALVLQQRFDEAKEFAVLSRDAGTPFRVLKGVIWRAAYAQALAGTGEHERAADVAREAIASADRTDYLNLRADALVAYADVLKRSGDSGWIEPMRRAGELYEAKGNVVSAARIRRVLEPAAMPSR